jgi:rhodanese-related sulfurtransferase
MRTVLLTILLAFTFAGVSSFAEEEAVKVAQNTKPLEDVKKEIEDGKAILVDCREKHEWDAGHLASARWLALSELKSGAKAASELPKDKTVYVHCVKGVRAWSTAQLLAKEGIHAVPLREGYEILAKTFDVAK